MKYEFILKILFHISGFILCISQPANSISNSFHCFASFGFKVDWKYSHRIEAIERIYDSPLSPKGSVYIPETSGMKSYLITYPYTAIKLAYNISKNSNFSVSLHCAVNKRGQLFKTYYLDTLNEYKEIEYTYLFLDYGIGGHYKIHSFSVCATINKTNLLNHKIIYTPKLYNAFISTIPKKHWYLTPNYFVELEVSYNLTNLKFNPGFSFFIQPYFNKSNSTVLGLSLNLKIR